MNNNLEKLNKKIRKQRIFIFLTLVSLPVVFFFSKGLYEKNIINNSKYTLLDPLREFVSADSYLINIQNLREYLFTLQDKYPDSLSVYYENINSGSNISINKDLHLFPASLSKLVQAILVTYKVEKGNLSWDKKIEVLKDDLSSGSGSLYKNGVMEYSVEELLRELLVNSDNTAQNVFRRYLDVSDYLKFQDETGLQDLYNEKGLISAKEYTRLLRVLYTSSFLKPENSQKILDYMSEATFKDYLSQGIPNNVKFAHKYGENTEYKIFADSGIVYIPGRPYMLTVIIKGKDSTEETRDWAKSLMKEISEHAYNTSK